MTEEVRYQNSQTYTETIWTNDTQIFSQVSWIREMPTDPDIEVPTSFWFPETAICIGMNLISSNWVCPLEGNDIYASLRLEYQFLVEHTGWVEVEHTITGSGPSQQVQTRLLDSHDEYDVSMKPVFVLEVRRDDSSGSHVQTHTVEFPFIGLVDVDGGNNGIPISQGFLDLVTNRVPGSNILTKAVGEKLYFWDEFAQVGTRVVDNGLGSVHSVTDTIDLVDYPLMELLVEIINTLGNAYPPLKAIAWAIKLVAKFVDVRLVFSIDPVASIQNMVQILPSTSSPSMAYWEFQFMSTDTLGAMGGFLSDSDQIADGAVGATMVNHTITGSTTDSSISMIPTLYWNVETQISYSANLRIVQPDNSWAAWVWDLLEWEEILIPIVTGLWASGAEFERIEPISDSWTSHPRTFGTSGSNSAPSAALSHPSTAMRGASVSFDASGSSDGDGDSLLYAYDFGDGSGLSMSDSASVNHVYESTGSFTTQLRVFDGTETVSSSTGTISVSDPPNNPLVASLSANPLYPDVNDLVSFDASGSTMNIPANGQYYFDFGDGVTSGWISSPTTTHTYSTQGSYDVLLWIDDGTGWDYTFERVFVTDPNAVNDARILFVIDESGKITDPMTNAEAIFNTLGRLSAGDIMETMIVGDTDRDGMVDDATASGPSAAEMLQYEVVIWSTGLSWTDTLTTADQAAIDSYWSQGGNIWLIGQDILFDLEPGNSVFTSGSFAYDTLGLDGANQDAGLPSMLNGAEYSSVDYSRVASGLDVPTQVVSDAIGGGSEPYEDGLSYREGFTAPVFNSTGTNEVSGTYRLHSSGGSLLFYAFELAAITDEIVRDDLIYRTLVSLFNPVQGDDSFADAKQIFLTMDEWTWDIIGEGWDSGSTEDYYKIWIPQGMGVVIDLWIVDHPTDDFDLYFYNCESLSCEFESNLSTDQQSSIVVWTAGSGFFWIRVDAYSGAGYYYLQARTYDDQNQDFSTAIDLGGPGTYDDLLYQVVTDIWDPVDYYSIDLNAGDYLSVTVEWDQPDADIDLAIYSSSYTWLDGSSFNDPLEQAGTSIASTGTYYIVVSAWNVDSWQYSGHYTITVETATPPPPDFADDETTTYYMEITGLYWYNLTLDSIFDPSDWYSIYLYEGEDISIFFSDAESGTDFDLELYYNNGGMITNRFSQLVAGSWDLNTVGDRIEYVVPTTGLYYLNISAYTGSGWYHLRITDNNDVPSDAREVYSNTVIEASLYFRTAYSLDENDYYKIYLFTGETITVTMTSTDVLADFDLYLLSATNSVLDSSESITSAETLSWSVAYPGFYLIRASSFDGTGAYQLDIGVTFDPGTPVNNAPTYTGGLVDTAVNPAVGWSVDLDNYFVDAEGDPLTYTSSHSEIAIDGLTGVASWNPNAGDASLINVFFTASDGELSSFTAQFDLTLPQVQNQAPQLTTSIPSGQIDEGTVWSLDLDNHFQDLDGDTITYTSNFPLDISIDSSMNIATWTADRDLLGVIITASDGTTTTESNAFNLVLVPAEDDDPTDGDQQDAAGQSQLKTIAAVAVVGMLLAGLLFSVLAILVVRKRQQQQGMAIQPPSTRPSRRSQHPRGHRSQPRARRPTGPPQGRQGPPSTPPPNRRSQAPTELTGGFWDDYDQPDGNDEYW